MAREQTTAATTIATTIATTMTVMTTAAAVVIATATTVAAHAVAAMATMTGDSAIVGTHQGDSDGGEKQRHTKENDFVHFCIPPFDSLVGVDH